MTTFDDFIPSGSTVSRPLTVWLNGKKIYPRFFGAVGDGITDDTAALQTLMNSAELTPGTVIDFEGKTYATSQQVILSKPGIRLEMEGSLIKLKNQYEGFLVVKGDNITIHRPTIKGDYVRDGNPRRYWINQSVNSWQGTTGYSKASAILATDVEFLMISYPHIENVFTAISLQGWNS